MEKNREEKRRKKEKKKMKSLFMLGTGIGRPREGHSLAATIPVLVYCRDWSGQVAR